MQKISAIVETRNDERRIGRLLETLRAVDHIVIVDHGSRDGTLGIARSYGAVICTEIATALDACVHDWVLVVRPDEGIHESFEASLLEWKTLEPEAVAYAVEFLAEENDEKRRLPAEVRLAHRTQARWRNLDPEPDQPHAVLAGFIGRFPE